MSKLKSFLSSVFTIDPRSYRLFLIFLGALSLWDISVRFPEVTTFYSSEGILSDQAFRSHYEQDILWSFSFISRSILFQQILLLIQAILSLALIFGRFPRVLCLAIWILTASRHVSNPFVLSAGDELLRHLFFWSCFLSTPKTKGLNAGAIALGVQLTAVYFFSALMKTSSVWRSNGIALEMALKLESFAHPFTKILLEFPTFLRVSTVGAWYLELLAPLFFVVTSLTKRGRLTFVLIMICFHLFLAGTFRLGYFPFVCIAGWVLWLPRNFWDFLPARRTEASEASETTENRNWFDIGLKILCFYLLLFSIAINFKTSAEKRFYPGEFLVVVGNTFQLWQMWAMFAPVPSVDDGWNQFEAVLPDGTRKHLSAFGNSDDGQIIPENSKLSGKPENLGAMYKSAGWKKFLYSMHQDDTKALIRDSYIEYLCRLAMKKNPGLVIDYIDYFYNVQWTKPDLTIAPPERLFIYNHSCPK
jgi:hypothetical protein